MEKHTKIYIAGHGGLVGSALVKKFQSEGYSNILLKTSKELDLRNQTDVNCFFEKEQPEVVILAAAKVGGVQTNATYPFDMLYENIQIQTNVIGAANTYNTKKLLFISSSTIYPSECNQPIKETVLLEGKLDPLHESYGLAKICGIKLCEKIQKQSNKEFFALVPTNIYGVGDHFEETRAHVIGALMTRFHNAKNNNIQNVSVRGSGNALREFIYVDDVADACYFFLTHPTSSPHINIGTSQEISIKDLSCMIKKIVGYTGEIIFDTTKPEGRLKRKLDTSLAKTYGRNASTSLESGIQKTYEYFLSIL